MATNETVVTTVPDCEICNDVKAVVELSGDLVKALRKLRYDLYKCEQCERREGCDVLQVFYAQVTGAIALVQVEWMKLQCEVQKVVNFPVRELPVEVQAAIGLVEQHQKFTYE